MDRVDRASATETVDSGSTPGCGQTKHYKIGIYSFTFSNKKGQREASTMCGRQVAAWLEDQKVPLLSLGQGNLVKKPVITIVSMISLVIEIWSEFQS